MNAEINVLLIEDSPAEQRIIEEYVKDIGENINLTKESNLSGAIERLSKSSFDLVFCDLTLPDSAGVDTFIRLTAKFKNIPVIVLSNLEDQDIAESLVRIGAEDYIFKKDITPQVLKNAIRNAQARSSSQSSAKKEKDELNSLDSSIGSYKHSTRLFTKQPLSLAIPELFHSLCEDYSLVLPVSEKHNKNKIQELVSKHINPHSEGLYLLKVSPFDFCEIHHQSIKEMGFINTQDSTFRKYSLMTLFEAMNSLYDVYANA